MSNEYYGLVGRLLKCPVCGKKFIPASQHIYKKKTRYQKDYKSRYVCSWGCQRKSEAEYEQKYGKGKVDYTYDI